MGKLSSSTGGRRLVTCPLAARPLTKVLTVQHDAPTSALDDFASTLFALNRTPAGLWSILLLSEIERLQRRGIQPNVEMLVRGMGAPKTQVWGLICEAESIGLLKSRLVHQHHLAHKLTPHGRAVLNDAREVVAVLLAREQPQEATPAVRSRSRAKPQDGPGLQVVGA